MTDDEIKEACRLAADTGEGECWACHGMGHFDEYGQADRVGRDCMECRGGRLVKVARALRAVVAQRDEARAASAPAPMMTRHSPIAALTALHDYGHRMPHIAQGPTCNHCRGPLQNLGCDCLGEQRGYQRALDEVAAWHEAQARAARYAVDAEAHDEYAAAIRAGRVGPVPTKPAGGDRG